jgi:C4-type Zn-finger protein
MLVRYYYVGAVLALDGVVRHCGMRSANVQTVERRAQVS